MSKTFVHLAGDFFSMMIPQQQGRCHCWWRSKRFVQGCPRSGKGNNTPKNWTNAYYFKWIPTSPYFHRSDSVPKYVFLHMGVSKNRGETPQIIHLFIGFSINYKPSIWGVKIPLFLVQQPYVEFLYVETGGAFRVHCNSRISVVPFRENHLRGASRKIWPNTGSVHSTYLQHKAWTNLDTSHEIHGKSRIFLQFSTRKKKCHSRHPKNV